MKHNTSLKRYRQFAGYTQQSISYRLKMPLSTYQQKEQGRISFSNSEMSKIKNILSEKLGKLTIDEIFFA